MDIREIKDRIQKINDMSGDDEIAHGEEDDLRDEFITDLAKRKDGIGKKAKLILTTKDIDFVRWCA